MILKGGRFARKFAQDWLWGVQKATPESGRDRKARKRRNYNFNRYFNKIFEDDWKIEHFKKYQAFQAPYPKDQENLVSKIEQAEKQEEARLVEFLKDVAKKIEALKAEVGWRFSPILIFTFQKLITLRISFVLVLNKKFIRLLGFGLNILFQNWSKNYNYFDLNNSPELGFFWKWNSIGSDFF